MSKSDSNNSKKIRLFLSKGLYPMIFSDGKIKLNDEFVEKIVEGEEEFRSFFMVAINDGIGLHNWAIDFKEYPVKQNAFFVDIYADSLEDYQKIVDMINSQNLNLEFRFWYKGPR